MSTLKTDAQDSPLRTTNTDAQDPSVRTTNTDAQARDHRSWGFTSSTGLGFTHASIVETHFEACRDQYRAMLDKAGFRAGWHILDAGCGSGSFLPWLAETAGAEGRITGVDLAPEHVSAAAERVRGLSLPCPVEVRQGNVLRLPLADDSVDAVWCANTVQYLDDADLARALREMRRVVRPGGVVAVKELDATLIGVRPGDPFMFADFFRAASASPGYARQLVRSRELYRWMAEAGLEDIRQDTALIEHFAPLSAAERMFYGQSCARLAALAESLGLDVRFKALLDPDDPGNPLNDRHGYICEGNVVAVGTVR